MQECLPWLCCLVRCRERRRTGFLSLPANKPLSDSHLVKKHSRRNSSLEPCKSADIHFISVAIHICRFLQMWKKMNSSTNLQCSVCFLPRGIHSNGCGYRYTQLIFAAIDTDTNSVSAQGSESAKSESVFHSDLKLISLQSKEFLFDYREKFEP